MSIKISLIVLLSLMVVVDNKNPNMNHKIPVELQDETLLQHFSFVTSYEHSFENQTEGDCGSLFEIAVKEYDEIISKFVNLDDLVRLYGSTKFEASKCKHTYNAFSWVLLVVEDDLAMCEVHVPLDFRNYFQNNNPLNSVLVEEYAKAAIDHGQTHCINKRTDSIVNQDEENLLQVVLYNIDEKKLSDPKKFEEEVERIEDSLVTIDSIEPVNGLSHIDGLDINDFNHFINCTIEDKKRVIDLYAAAIITSKIPGIVIYTENILNCRTYSEHSEAYITYIALNDQKYFARVLAISDKGALDYQIWEVKGNKIVESFRSTIHGYI